MNVSKAVEKIGKKMEIILENDENALSWDQDIEIKNGIVKTCKLEKIFSDTSRLENMYTYEMFDEQYKTTNDQKVKMVQTWIKLLNQIANIDVEINPKDIK